MSDDEFLRIRSGPSAGESVEVEVTIVSWNESNVTEIVQQVVAPLFGGSVPAQPITIPTKPGEIRITSSRDVAVKFSTLLPTWMARDFCRALIQAAMDRFMELDLRKHTVELIGGMEFFEGSRYKVGAP